MAKAKNPDGSNQLGSEQIAALNMALESAKSEGQEIGKLSVAEITSLLNIHANAAKVIQNEIPKQFKLLKNHALVRDGKTGSFYEAGTVLNSADHRDLVTTLVRSGAQLEEIPPTGNKESAKKKKKPAVEDDNSGNQDNASGNDADENDGNQQDAE
jgi:hypothetical protein